jgi:aldehyde:ferredoxin oxidoreductase
MRTGERIFTLKRLINVGRGAGGAADRLPARLLTRRQREDIGPVQPAALAGMLAEYYSLRGWDAGGGPTPDRLRALSLA